MTEIILRTTAAGLLVLLALWLLRRGPARRRVVVSRFGLIAIVAAAIGFRFHIPNPETPLVISSGSAGPPAEPATNWLPLALWTAGAALAALPLARGALMLRRLWRQGTDASVSSGSVKAKFGEVPTPLVFGYPGKLLLPSSICDWPSLDRVNAIEHELAHIRAKDPVWVTAFGIANAVFWWQPAVRLITARHRRDIELAADHAVLAGGADPAEYAQTLLSLSQIGHLGIGCAATGGGPLEERIRGALTFSRVDRRFPVLAIPVAVVAMSVAVVGFSDREVIVRSAPAMTTAPKKPSSERKPKLTVATAQVRAKDANSRPRRRKASAPKVTRTTPSPNPVSAESPESSSSSTDPISKASTPTTLPGKDPFGAASSPSEGAFPKLSTSEGAFGSTKSLSGNF